MGNIMFKLNFLLKSDVLETRDIAQHANIRHIRLRKTKSKDKMSLNQRQKTNKQIRKQAHRPTYAQTYRKTKTQIDIQTERHTSP